MRCSKPEHFDFEKCSYFLNTKCHAGTGGCDYQVNEKDCLENKLTDVYINAQVMKNLLDMRLVLSDDLFKKEMTKLIEKIIECSKLEH